MQAGNNTICASRILGTRPPSEATLKAVAEAASVSGSAFRKAQRNVPKGPARTVAFAKQAQDYLDAVEAVGMLDSPLTATLVRQARGNLTAASKLTRRHAEATATPLVRGIGAGPELTLVLQRPLFREMQSASVVITLKLREVAR